MAMPQKSDSRSSKNGITPAAQEALRLRALGYSVIPIKRSEKTPLIGWKEFQERIATEEEIRDWYDRWPNAGLGLVTESTLVIDDDDKDGGYEFSKRLEAEDLKHPKADTPRGGKHHVFGNSIGFDVRSSAGVLAANVDVRAKGGYIVVWPSIRNEVGAYLWADGRRLDAPPCELPLPPTWLVEELIAKASSTKKGLAKEQAASRSVDVIRNVNYTREAGYLRRMGSSQETILAYLQARDLESTNPIGNEELKTISSSISQCEPNQAMYEQMGGFWSTPRLGLPTGAVAHKVPTINVELLMDLENRAAVNDLVPGLIPEGVLCFVVAKPAAGKSLFLEGIAYSVSTGMPLLKNGPAPTKTGWVLLLLSEGANSWGARSKAFREYYEIEPTDQIVAVTMGVDFTEPSRITALVGAINDEIEKRNGELPTVVILDTLSASIPGLDENQQASMTPVCGAMQSWAAEGVTIIVAHHLTKDGTRVRGSSVIEASAERSLLIKNSNGRCLVTAEKVRDGAVQPFVFEIAAVDGYPVPIHQPSNSLEFILVDAEKEMLEALEDCGFNNEGGPATGVFSNGVTTNDIVSSWQAKHPVTPARQDNQQEYDKERNRRKSQTASVMKHLQESGYLGSDIHGIATATKTQIHKAKFTQVFEWQEE